MFGSRCLVLMVLFGAISLCAQTTQVFISKDYQFREGYELMEQKLYGRAFSVFENYLSIAPEHDVMKPEAHYFLAFCALQNQQTDAEARYYAFTSTYPMHPKAVMANFDLGKFHFQQKNYKTAIQYFEKMNATHLGEDLKNELNFKLGYAYMNEKQFEKASTAFEQLKKSKNQYQGSAFYYGGFCHYKNGKFAEALADFKKSEEFEEFKPMAPTMMMSAMNKLKQFDEMIALEKRVLSNSVAIKSPEEFFVLAGEAHFQKKNFLGAVKSFEKSGKQESFAGDTLYRYAYSLYMSESYENAIKHLKKLNPTNIYGQYAAYYLGLCYLKNGNKPYAVNAFVQSAKLNFDETDIKPMALFYAGKTHFDLRNFDDATIFLKDYVKKYPDHIHHQEANELLGESLLNTSNFSDAIAYVENSKTKSKRLNATYQKVTFYKGMEHFNDGEFDKSLQLLEKSLNHPISSNFSQKANFWKGEALSFQRKYEEAIDAYQKMTKDDPLLTIRSFYGMAYAYFNLKRYDKSAEFFKKFIDAPEAKQFQSFFADAQLRMADNYYATKKYDLAIEMYDKCMTNPHMQDHEHAVFHKAVVLWLSGKYDQGRETFDFLIRRYPQSRFFDNALYQRSELELERGAYKEAVQSFNIFLEKAPNSQLVPNALLKKGLANTNLKNYKEAEKNFNQLLAEYPRHEMAVTALQSLQEVLSADGRAEDFEESLQQFKDKNPENTGLENLDFESIKSNYLTEKYAIVRKNFIAFEKKFPSSSHLDELNFYYADASYRMKDTTAALEYFSKVINNGKTNFTNRSIRTSAELESGQKNYAKAVRLYLDLNGKAVNKKELQAAWMGLAENYFSLAKHDSSLVFAKQVLSLGNVQLNAVNKSNLIVAKSLLFKKDTLAAQEYLMELLNNAQDEFGAEGNYWFAKILYHKKDHKQSLDKLFYLNEKYASYQKWVNQSFMLIADNYIALGELFQARATLNSIIEYSKDKELIQKAKVKLESIAPQTAEEKN